MATHSQTLLSVFEPRLYHQPTAPAIILPASSLPPSTSSTSNSTTTTTARQLFSYAQLEALVLDLQAQLATLGLQPGDVVSSSLGNGIEFVGCFFAVGAERLTAAPLNPAYSASEVLFYLQDTQSKLLLLPQGSVASNTPAAQAAHDANVPVLEIHLSPAFSSSSTSTSTSTSLANNNNNNQPRLQLTRSRPGSTGKSGGVRIEPTRGAVRLPQPDDTALVLHTSGTTGRPKGVPLSHANLVQTMRNIVLTYDLTPNDRSYLVMPLFHVHGLLASLLAPLLSGGCVVLPPRFSASAFWKQFGDERCTWYSAVPTIHQMLLLHDRANNNNNNNTSSSSSSSAANNSSSSSSNQKLPYVPSRLRFVRSCSSALSPSTLDALERALGVPVLEAYAMTEAAHQMSANPLPTRGPRKAGSVGRAQGGVELRILDAQGVEVPQGTEGEVCVRGANVTKGYLRNEKANAEAFVHGPERSRGFFRTGDQGRMDEEGYLFLTGRIKELINRAGEKISPLEVDAALLSVAGVAEAVSFGVPDDTYGEKVGAAVVLQVDTGSDGGEGKMRTPEEIRKALEGKLSKFKIPEQIFVTKGIPKTATGKIQRRNVAAAFLRKEGAKL